MGNCKICDTKYHSCSSCGLTDSEEAPYYNGVCDKCFNNSGARAVYIQFEQIVDEAEHNRDKQIDILLNDFKLKRN